MSGERVAFVGLGAMGWPMAARLVGAGFDVVGVDARPGRAEEFARGFGASAAPDPAQAAPGAAVVVTMLPASPQVEEVLGAMRPRLTPGALVLEMTSGQPAATRRLAEALAADGIALVDAPVSGGVPRARDGTLAIMAGGRTRCWTAPSRSCAPWARPYTGSEAWGRARR